MFYQGQMMNYNEGSCGCNTGCPTAYPTSQQCNQVVQTCNVQDVPHYINYHTHVVNNCIKRHINIPTYSTSAENVMIDEYVQGSPMYAQPMMYGQPMYNQGMSMNQQMMYSPNQYQGNIGTEGLQQQMQQTPFQGMANPMNPFNG